MICLLKGTTPRKLACSGLHGGLLRSINAQYAYGSWSFEDVQGVWSVWELPSVLSLCLVLAELTTLRCCKERRLLVHFHQLTTNTQVTYRFSPTRMVFILLVFREVLKSHHFSDLLPSCCIPLRSSIHLPGAHHGEIIETIRIHSRRNRHSTIRRHRRTDEIGSRHSHELSYRDH